MTCGARKWCNYVSLRPTNRPRRNHRRSHPAEPRARARHAPAQTAHARSVAGAEPHLRRISEVIRRGPEAGERALAAAGAVVRRSLDTLPYKFNQDPVLRPADGSGFETWARYFVDISSIFQREERRPEPRRESNRNARAWPRLRPVNRRQQV